jgi:hypothetical protein
MHVTWAETDGLCRLATIAETNGILVFNKLVGLDLYDQARCLDGYLVTTGSEIGSDAGDGSFEIQEPDGALKVYGATDTARKQITVDNENWRYSSFFHEFAHAQQFCKDGVIDSEHTSWEANHFWDAIQAAHDAM